MRWVVKSDPLGALIPFWEHIMNLNVFGCTLDDSINRYMFFFQNLFSLLFAHIWESKLHTINEYFRNWEKLVWYHAINLFVERTYDFLVKIGKLISILTSYLTNRNLFFILIFFLVLMLCENFQTACAWDYGFLSRIILQIFVRKSFQVLLS